MREHFNIFPFGVSQKCCHSILLHPSRRCCRHRRCRRIIKTHRASERASEPPKKTDEYLCARTIRSNGTFVFRLKRKYIRDRKAKIWKWRKKKNTHDRLNLASEARSKAESISKKRWRCSASSYIAEGINNRNEMDGISKWHLEHGVARHSPILFRFQYLFLYFYVFLLFFVSRSIAQSTLVRFFLCFERVALLIFHFFVVVIVLGVIICFFFFLFFALNR